MVNTQDESNDPEPQRQFLPDGRPIATKRIKRKPPQACGVEVQAKITVEAAPERVSDRCDIEVPPGGRVLIAGNLSLTSTADPASEAACAELAKTLRQQQGPAVLVLAGNTFDLVTDSQLDPGRALLAHRRFTSAVADFGAAPDRRVVVLPGNFDSCLAWHEPAIEVVTKRLGATVALSADVSVHTGAGTKRIRVEPGHAFDPFDAFDDPRNPGESPLGRHAHEMLQHLRVEAGDWVEGVQLLADPSQMGSFVGARLLYRRMLRRFAWALIPMAIAAVLYTTVHVLAAVGVHAEVLSQLRRWVAALGVGGVALLGVLAVAGALWWWTIRGPIQALSLGTLHDGRSSEDPNASARAAATRFAGQDYAGLVVAHTNIAELTNAGDAFFANVGCGGRVAVRRPGRFGAPDAWTVAHQQSWIELEAGAQLHVRLHHARQQPPTTTLLERLLTQDTAEGAAHPEVVATWPAGNDWPVPAPHGIERRRARRIAASAIAISGVANIVSAVIPPRSTSIEAVTDVVPLAVSQAAAMVVVLAGIVQLLVARGVRRGQRHAWLVAVVALFATFGLHVVKGLDFEESVVAALVGVYLLANRRHFKVQSDDWSLSRGLGVLAVGLATAIGSAMLAIKAVPGHRHPGLTWVGAAQAGAERLIGSTTIEVGPRLDRYLVPTMLSVSVSLVLVAGWILFGPVLARRLSGDDDDEARARRIVGATGGDTLAYFSLRSDKRWFFHGDTLVAYAVTQGVALVSPDPIGPVGDRRMAWFAFRQFADDHGWPIAVMGASEEWLPIYRSTGMRELYVGDEAVVDVRRFSLEGGRNKGLRQAVNRIDKAGYRMEFHDPTDLDPTLEAGVRALMTESRRGEVERGFSMTLGRVFDPHDTGLLLAICLGPDGTPAAFCQYVPAPAVQGYSLDLMRRSESDEHPNGLTDYVVVETMRHLNELGMVGLGLNFATMRGVLAGERGDGTTRRVERWFYKRMSDTMQIESLWRYNEKFDPDWVPRYACYDAPEHLLVSATALAKAESWWEIPVVGRFFKPDESGVGECPACTEPTIEPEPVTTSVPAGVDVASGEASGTVGPSSP